MRSAGGRYSDRDGGEGGRDFRFIKVLDNNSPP